MFLYLFIAAVTYFVYRLIKYYLFVAKYPKGPFPLPFIGNCLEFEWKAQYKPLKRLGKRYGKIYTIFAPVPMVQINDFELIKEAFIEKGDVFVGRPQIRIIQDNFMFGPNTGVVNSIGDNWREQRRAAISILRDFGMGKNLMEQLVRSSIVNYLAHLDSIEDKEHADMRWPLQIMVANVINDVLFGFRYDFGNCEPLMDYINGFNKMMDMITSSIGLLITLFIPGIKKIHVIGWYTIGRVLEDQEKLNQILIDHVDRSLKDYNTDEEPNCFVQAYRQRMGQNEYLDQVNLFATCSDFFIAGIETTTSTLRWAMLFLAKHQDAQEKLRREIHEIVGSDRLPEMADQAKMPYARACILEVQRRAKILQTNVIRVTTEDVEIGGHTIPKDTWVNGDIHYLMANDPLFVNPEEFRPERYLNEVGNTLRKELVERTLPFSLGKRACAGESIARVELFLGLTATLQRYRIMPCEGLEIDLDPAPGPIITPKEQNVRLERV